ncbi:hypothetical protein CEXT_412001 [Caerostris extrusa]|uniref:Uncharacterized protein n=1 Tax=Caerostris extrusa TaxID=172846 RepID=A0AAV4UIF7_CAEEX|nr:hypothetical protein CEXT_412001 [Caerostris extrusa]
MPSSPSYKLNNPYKTHYNFLAPQPIKQPYKTFWDIPVPFFLKHLFQQDKLSSETGQTVGVGEGAVVILGGARRTASMIVRGGKPSISLVAICHYNAAHVRLIRKKKNLYQLPKEKLLCSNHV